MLKILTARMRRNKVNNEPKINALCVLSIGQEKSCLSKELSITFTEGLSKPTTLFTSHAP